MSIDRLSSRAVIGEFYKALESAGLLNWIMSLSMYFTSDQDMETYAWLGQSPVMREWVGGRQAKGLTENGIDVRNKHFEATIEILVKHLRRDKSGQALVRIRELAQRTNSHWAMLLSQLVQNGETGVCYDGQYFFDTDHQEGKSGVQSNLITTDISELPVEVHGAAASAPSVEEVQQAIIKSIVTISGFKDDQGEPFNEGASEFLVMVPINLLMPATNAFSMVKGTGSTEQQTLPEGVSVKIVGNTRLTWTDKFATFRADSEVSPFIRQEETGVQLKAKAEGSEFEFDNDAHQYGVDTWRNVAYGYWQLACLNQLV